MDLLGSILGSMQKPPKTKASEEQKMAKKANEKMEEIRKHERQHMHRFRQNIEEQINKFMANDSETKVEFKPMDKMHRCIIHDVAEIAGLSAFSFGTEDVDRHIVVYKKEFTPNEDELNALRKGEEYDPKKVELMKQMELEEKNQKKVHEKDIIPNKDFRDKYEKIIGLDAGKSAAQVTTPNKQFGFVPSANKRDQRSIEQILADNKKKKFKNESEDNVN
ncbi:sperm-associated antigen 7 homolog [Oppia nitens]|uniref:sperm-associated antigen 7 homolog n=1 Tax=Oppia nitens TaxID=1686743 RepID=UPI0023DA2B76|nr:sperm-associated antigen 7 homolog [Oppia nitens]